MVPPTLTDVVFSRTAFYNYLFVNGRDDNTLNMQKFIFHMDVALQVSITARYVFKN